MAIMWLLAGYNVDLRGKKFYLIGRGKLVGAPLEKMLQASDLTEGVADRANRRLGGGRPTGRCCHHRHWQSGNLYQT